MSRFFNLSQRKSRVYQPANGNSRHSLDIENLVDTSLEPQHQPGEALPSPIKTATTIHLKSGLPVVLAESGGTSHGALEAYRALRTRLLRVQAVQKIRSVALTSALKGEGKTLTATNLALCYAQLFNTRVLLVDGDLRTHGLSGLLSHTQGPGLAEVLQGSAPFESAVVSTNLANLFVVGAGESSIAASELYAKPQWKDFMEWCGESFNLVLVDSPPILGLADFELIAARCDGIVMVVRARATERETLENAVRELDKKKLLGVVLNGHEGSHKPYYYDYGRSVTKK